MDIKKILCDKKIIILLIVFAILAVSDIIYSSLVRRAVTFDGTSWFAYTLDRLSGGAHYAFKSEVGIRPRTFINIMHALFLNISYFLGLKSKYWLQVMYSIPHFLFTFLILLYHYILSFRSKRTDIFLCALIFYVVLIIPVNYYPICEISLALSFGLLLYHYICADIKYNWGDYILILFLIISLFDSSEAYLYIGLIMFVAAMYHAHKTEDKKLKFIKYFMGASCLLASGLQIFYYLFFNWDYVNSDRASYELQGIFGYLRSYMFVVDTAFVYITALFLFKKEKLNNKEFILFICGALFLLGLFLHNNLYLKIDLFIRRFFPYLVVPALIILDFIFDINRKKIAENKINTFLYNSVILFCLVGCVYSTLSLCDARCFSLAVKKLNQEVSAYQNTIILPDKHLSSFYYNDILGQRHFSCNTYIYDYINFADDYEFNSMLTPNFSEENCPKRMYFTDNQFALPYDYLSIQNEFWDFSKVKQMIENDEFLRVKYSPENFSETDNYEYHGLELKQ